MKVLTRLFQKSKKQPLSKLENRLQNRVYDSIDTLPIFRWWKIHETEDFSFLIKDNTEKATEQDFVFLSETWKKIYSEYIKRFGFGETFLRIKQREASIARLQCELVITGDRSILLAIKVEEAELKKMKTEQSGKNDFHENKAAIEKAIGFRLDPKSVTVAEFYSYISVIKQHGNKRPN